MHSAAHILVITNLKFAIKLEITMQKQKLESGLVMMPLYFSLCLYTAMSTNMKGCRKLEL